MGAVLIVTIAVVGLIVANATAAHRRSATPIALVEPLDGLSSSFGPALRSGHRRPPVVRPRRAPRRRLRDRRPTTAVTLFVVCAAIYLTLGAILSLRYGSINGDSTTRVTNAWNVFFSRDPHIAAIGFVWNPLPSILVMPFFVFKDVWPALIDRAFAMCIVSSLCMAGAVVQVRGIMRDLGLGAVVAWSLTLIFALNPMIVYFGASGLTEALYLLTLIFAVRQLMRWLVTARSRNLVYAGVALGVCYLARYEAVPATMAAALFVLIVTFTRTVGARRERWLAAGADAFVFVVPFGFAFLGWAVVSYIITGHPFEQFASQYDNSAQLGLLNSSHGAGTFSRPLFGIIQLLAYGPALPLLAVAVTVLSILRRDRRMLALSILAAPIAFTYLGFLQGSVYGWFRYYIPAMPLTVLTLGVVIALLQSPAPERRTKRTRITIAAITSVVVVAIGVGGGVTTALAMSNQTVGNAEYQYLAWVIRGHTDTPLERATQAAFPSTDKLAAEWDKLHLPDGDVVTDTFTPCTSIALMRMNHPHQFVITSDRSFERTVADPVTFHAHYLLVPEPGPSGSLDAVNIAYPGLYAGGAGIATRIAEYATIGCPTYRLYKITADNPRPTVQGQGAKSS
jgi:hypothetical protein